MEWLTSKEVASMLKVSPSAIHVWIHRKIGLPYVRIGRTIRFRREALDKFLLDKENRIKVKNFEK
jgi:excisionase family DNA binding protein